MVTNSSIAALAGGATFVSLGAYLLYNKLHTSISSGKKKNERLHFTKLIRIPRSAVGAILGKHGSTLRTIEFETQTFLQILYYSSSSYNQHRTAETIVVEEWDSDESDPVSTEEDKWAFVKVMATSSRQVHLVVLALKGIIDDCCRGRTTVSLQIPADCVGFVIGKHGCNIKKISQMCRVRCRISQDGNPIEALTIEGSEHGIQNAQRLFEESIARYHRVHNPVKNNGLASTQEDYNQELANIRALIEENDDVEEW